MYFIMQNSRNLKEAFDLIIIIIIVVVLTSQRSWYRTV